MDTLKDTAYPDAVSEALSQLQSNVSDRDTLISLLAAPLEAIGLLPPAFRRFNSCFYASSIRGTVSVSKHIHRIQSALLERIVPVWEDQLRDDDLDQILYQYFSPDAFFSASQDAVHVALHGYLSLASNKLGKFEVETLRRLHVSYPLDRLHSAIFSETSSISPAKRMLIWEDIIRYVVSVPTKVANFYGSSGVPPDLEPRNYFTQLCQRAEILISSIRGRTDDGEFKFTRAAS